MPAPQNFFLDGNGPAIHALRLVQVAFRRANCRQVVQGDGNFVMVWAISPPETVQGAPIKLFRLSVFPLTVKDGGQRREVGGYDRMIRPQRLFSDADGAARQRFATRVSLAGMFQASEIMIEVRKQAGGTVREFLRKPQRPSVNPCGFRVASELLVKNSKAIEKRCDFEVIRPAAGLGSGEQTEEDSLSSPVLS